MDVVQLARDLRLAFVQNTFDQGLLTEDEAREILAGPLTPGDETTVYDDSGLLRSVQCPLCKGWGRFDMGGYLEECPECGGTGGVGVSAPTSAVPDRAIDTGDLILHKPSGEQCVVAAVEGNRVYWCGHPFGGSFSLADCELLKSASESERARVLCDLVSHSGNERPAILARMRQSNSVG